jgi:hypothetical protein
MLRRRGHRAASRADRAQWICSTAPTAKCKLEWQKALVLL